MRPLDEYPPGVRAPGEGYTGPIADPDEAVRACLASGDVLAQAAKFAADPNAPIKTYLSAKDVWERPWKYAGYARTEAPAPAHVPSQAERNAGAIQAGMDLARAAGTGGGVRVAAGPPDTLGNVTGLPFLDNYTPEGHPIHPVIENQSPTFKRLIASYNSTRPHYSSI